MQVCSCTKKLGFIRLPKPCEWEMKEDPQCWRTEPRDKQTSTVTKDTDITTASVTQTIIGLDDIEYENEVIDTEREEQEPEYPSSARSFILLVHQTAEKQLVCSSTIPLEDDWFCDNLKARFQKSVGFQNIYF